MNTVIWRKSISNLPYTLLENELISFIFLALLEIVKQNKNGQKKVEELFPF